MRVTVEVPDRVWWRAAQNAERQGITVADIAHTAILNAAGVESMRQIKDRNRRQAVIELARQGHTDAVIAERTGETRNYISTNRRRAGIKANRPGQAKSGRTAA